MLKRERNFGRWKKHGRLRRRGFTLIEVLLVLVILATLAAIVVPKFAGRSEQAKITAAQTQIANFETALDAFEVDNAYYPKGDDGLQLLKRIFGDIKGIMRPGHTATGHDLDLGGAAS